MSLPASRRGRPSAAPRRRATAAAAGRSRSPRGSGARRGAPARAARSRSTRSRSAALRPVAMSIGSTPSRSASQARSSSEGTTSPRSIWLTYCFVNRPSASSTCVIPAARRSARTRPAIPAADATFVASFTAIPPSDPSPRCCQTSSTQYGPGSGRREPGPEGERRGWDSNPRTSCPVSGFQDRPIRPLSHPAAPRECMHLAGGDGSPAELRSALARLGSDVCGEHRPRVRRARGVAVPFSRCVRPGADRGARRDGLSAARLMPASRTLPVFEYALLKRGKKRSAEETLWNALGLEGWELVGVTGKHAAFKRRL